MRSLSTNQSRQDMRTDGGQQPRSKSTILLLVPMKIGIEICLYCGEHDDSRWCNLDHIKKTFQTFTMNRKQHLLLPEKKIMIIKANTDFLVCKSRTDLSNNEN
ncbi:hypothetical protein V6Z11_D04G019400 [Gossypium hirsutum]